MPGFSPEGGLAPYQQELLVVEFMEEQLAFLREETGRLQYPTLLYMGSGGELLNAYPYSKAFFIDEKILHPFPGYEYILKDMSGWQVHEAVDPARDMNLLLNAFKGRVTYRVDALHPQLRKPMSMLNFAIPNYPLKELVYIQHKFQWNDQFQFPEIVAEEDELVLFVRGGIDILYNLQETKIVPGKLRPRAIIYDAASLAHKQMFDWPRELINAGYAYQPVSPPFGNWGYYHKPKDWDESYGDFGVNIFYRID